MHELAIVGKVIDIVEQVAEENQVEQVVSVTIAVGEVSGVVHAYLYDCWKWAIRRSTCLQHACLYIRTTEALTWCDDCAHVFSTLEHGKTCPYCGSGNTCLKQGNEFEITQIEVPNVP